MANPPASESISAMIERLCDTETEDWALILIVCEQASKDANASDEAINALIRIFSQGGPRHVRLNAARLWAVMIHNCSGIFFERTCSPVFLAVVKEVIDQRPEGHPLRDRLVETIGGAVFSCCRNNASHPLAQLWRQVKPSGFPNDGIPPGFQAPIAEEDETALSAQPETPFTDEPPSYGLENTHTNANANPNTRTRLMSTPLQPSTNNSPRRRVQTQTSSNPSTPNGITGGDGFAAQFYSQSVARSVQSDIPTFPDPNRRSNMSPSPAPFSLRSAFTQAVPLTTVMAGGIPGGGPTPQNTLDPKEGSQYDAQNTSFSLFGNNPAYLRSRAISTPPPLFTGNSSSNNNNNPASLSPLWTSVASTASAIPKAFESSITTLFASMKAMRGSNATMNLPIADFCSQIVKIPKAESGKVIMLTRRRVLGAVTHEFLMLEAVTPDGVPMYIRLDRRPMSGQRRALFLLSSATTASDSAIFATCEEPLLSSETSKVDAIVPFRDSPSLHDLGKLLWFIESEAPDYRLRKENCWFFCSVIQEVLTSMFRGHNHMGSLAHPDLGKDLREKIFNRARGPEGLSVIRELKS